MGLIILVFCATTIISQTDQYKPIVGKGDKWKIKYYEFVNHSGKSVKQINVPEDKEIKAPIWLSDKKKVLVERADMRIYHNHLLVVNTYKINLDKTLYNKTGNYGYESVWITVYDSTGNIIFKQYGVPYEFKNISEDGSKIACFIPCLQEDPNIEVSIPLRKVQDDSLYSKGKILVFDKNANILFEEYTQAYKWMVFSPNGKWLACRYLSNGPGFMINIDTRGKYKIPVLDYPHTKVKFVGMNMFERILDDGRIMGTIFYTTKGDTISKFIYDPKTNVFEIVKE